MAKIIRGTWEFPFSHERFRDRRLSTPSCCALGPQWRLGADAGAAMPSWARRAGRGTAPLTPLARLSCHPQTLGPAPSAGSRPHSAETRAPRPGATWLL